MRKLLALFLAALIFVPATAMAAASIEDLQLQIEKLNEELEYLSDRLDKPERHAALDKISFSGDLRVKADTLHYQDVTWNPGVMMDVNDFFGKAFADPDAWGLDMTAFDPETGAIIGNPIIAGSPLGDFFAAYPHAAALFGASGITPFSFVGPAQKTDDINNDIMYTTRMRLNMSAKVADNVNFSGRLTMYKNWGDSTGVKVFDSWDSFTMDGTDGGNTTGDWLRVERAYMDWKDIGGSNFYLSLGRRPSTYGPPSQYRENELRGGTPSGHLVHFNFDGITVGYHLSELTGIEGQTVRFCYGQGFESEWGNGELYNEINTDDTHLGGFNVDFLNDGTNFLQFTLFRALDVTDGFKGLIAFPTQFAPYFAPVLNQDLQNFPTFNFVTRVQPSTNIGDITLGGVGFTRQEENGINWFTSLGWTQTDPNGKTGMFGGLLSDPVYQAELNEDETQILLKRVGVTSNEKRDGFSVYAGVQVPAPYGKVGFEYNWGSKYWTPFTQAQDDLLGSKLATRGHVGEAYYIFDINPNMFIKVGGMYYDYEYTGSGSPVGEPQKVDDVLDGSAVSMLPVVDKAWDGYASLTVKF